jgi:hypothetical protein
MFAGGWQYEWPLIFPSEAASGGWQIFVLAEDACGADAEWQQQQGPGNKGRRLGHTGWRRVGRRRIALGFADNFNVTALLPVAGKVVALDIIKTIPVVDVAGIRFPVAALENDAAIALERVTGPLVEFDVAETVVTAVTIVPIIEKVGAAIIRRGVISPGILGLGIEAENRVPGRTAVVEVPTVDAVVISIGITGLRNRSGSRQHTGGSDDQRQTF